MTTRRDEVVAESPPEDATTELEPRGDENPELIKVLLSVAVT